MVFALIYGEITRRWLPLGFWNISRFPVSGEVCSPTGKLLLSGMRLRWPMEEREEVHLKHLHGFCPGSTPLKIDMEPKKWSFGR